MRRLDCFVPHLIRHFVRHFVQSGLCYCCCLGGWSVFAQKASNRKDRLKCDLCDSRRAPEPPNRLSQYSLIFADPFRNLEFLLAQISADERSSISSSFPNAPTPQSSLPIPPGPRERESSLILANPFRNLEFPLAQISADRAFLNLLFLSERAHATIPVSRSRRTSGTLIFADPR